MKNKISIEFQYFNDCPNSDILMDTLKESMKGYENFVEYRELIVDTNELAMEIGFLGSPTIIINGEDLLGLKSYLKPSLCCRFYQNGLPSIDFIRKKIEEEILDYNPSSL